MDSVNHVGVSSTKVAEMENCWKIHIEHKYD